MAGSFKYADFRAGADPGAGRTKPGKPPPPQGHPTAANQASAGLNGDTPGATNTVGQLSQLLDEVLAFLKRYIIFPTEDAAVAVTLWVAHTWTIDAFRFTPYLHISSPVRECGKSRLFACLSHLCMKPWCVFGHGRPHPPVCLERGDHPAERYRLRCSPPLCRYGLRSSQPLVQRAERERTPPLIARGRYVMAMLVVVLFFWLAGIR